MEQRVRARGRAPHPRAPHRMPPLTWTDWNTKVHPTVHHEGRWLARATGRARRGQDLRAESWTSGAEGCSGPSRGAQCSGWPREGAPVSQPPASIRSPRPPPHHPQLLSTLTTELQTEPLRASRSHQCHSLPCWNHFEIRQHGSRNVKVKVP